MDWIEILIVALSSVVTGILVWYVTTAISEKTLQKHLKINFSELAGRWEGIHLTRDDLRGGVIISRHSYDLKVSSSGKIKGICEELAGSPPYKFDIDGAVRYGEIFIMGKGEITQEISYTWFFRLYNLEQLRGFHLGYDFDGKPYASYIVLSRKRLDDEEYFDLLRKDLNSFYIYPNKEKQTA